MIMIISSLNWRQRREFTCTHCVTHLDRVRVFNMTSVLSGQHQTGYRYVPSAVSTTLCVSVGSLQPNPSLLAAFYNYIRLMPMVTEANQMSQELNKVMNTINS